MDDCGVQIMNKIQHTHARARTHTHTERVVQRLLNWGIPYGSYVDHFLSKTTEESATDRDACKTRCVTPHEHICRRQKSVYDFRVKTFSPTHGDRVSCPITHIAIEVQIDRRFVHSS